MCFDYLYEAFLFDYIPPLYYYYYHYVCCLLCTFRILQRMLDNTNALSLPTPSPLAFNVN